MLRSIKSLVISLVGISLPWLVRASGEQLDPPFGTAADVSKQEPVYIVATIIQVLLGLVGAATLLIFIWGGFKIIFSGGSEEKIKKGRDTLVWAVIGLAVILSSYAILEYTFSVLQDASTIAPTT